jgi:hypothetical protein
MPTVLTYRGIRFYFYSLEGNEPIHIHMSKGNAFGKIWIEPCLSVEYLYNFTHAEVRDIFWILEKNIPYIKTKWHEHFAS